MKNEKKLSEMFSDMVFLNETLGDKVVSIEKDLEQFKSDLINQLRYELSQMNRRLMLLETGEKPQRAYIVERE